MKKTSLLVWFAFLAYISSAQQQIGNSNFESWDNLGTSNEEPSNWNSFKTASGGLSGFASQQVQRSTAIRSGSTGSYCARIWSKSVLGTVANGNLTLGRIEMGNSTPTSTSNYNYSVTSNASFSEALTNTPDSIVFWVKYNPVVATGNEARISAVLHNNTDGYKDPNDVAGANTVATAIHNFPSTSGAWVRKSVPFTYVGNPVSTAFILVTFTTNKTPGGGSDSDEMFIDDVQLIYNQQIVANNDVASTYQDMAVNISVLTNDNDPENNMNLNSLIIQTNPTNGSCLVNNSTGVITYTPNPGFFGNDSFVYTICDNGVISTCSNATVNITVTQVIAGNNPIIANDDNASTNMNTAVVINVLANDSDYENNIDISSINVLTQPTNGTAVANTSTGEITYTPNINFFGNDSFTYSICDAGTPTITCDNATVNVTVDLTWGLDLKNEDWLQVYYYNGYLKLSQELNDGTFIIYATNGTKLAEGALSQTIAVSLEPGVYITHLNTSKGIFTKKFTNF